MWNAAAALDGISAHKRTGPNAGEIGGMEDFPEDMTDVPDHRNVTASRDGARRSKAKK